MNDPAKTQSKPPIYIDDSNLPSVVVFDIDGTVAKMNGRGPFEWLQVHTDLPVLPVIDVVRWAKQMGLMTVAVSGRDAVCRELTKQWLKAHEIPFDALYMRAQGDYRKDYVVKEEIYREHILGQYRIHFVLDDRTQVVDHLRSMGIRVFQVAPGDF